VQAEAKVVFDAYREGWRTQNFTKFKATLGDAVELSLPSGEFRGVATGAEGKRRLLAMLDQVKASAVPYEFSEPRIAVSKDSAYFEFSAVPAVEKGQPIPAMSRSLLVITTKDAKLTGFREYVGDLGESRSLAGTESEVTQSIQRWIEALIKGDAETISTLLAESYRRLTQDGVVMTGTQFLGEFSAGRPVFEGIQPQSGALEIMGDTAIWTGVMTLRTKILTSVTQKDFATTLIWTRVDGRWRLLSDQYTPIL
jgi:ketosteroid isomerase-like protein